MPPRSDCLSGTRTRAKSEPGRASLGGRDQAKRRNHVLLSVPGYDFGWQSVYRLAEPKPMPRGTRIDCLAHFDNSPNNPANPDPTRTVRWGEQTFDEMMIGFIDYSEDAPTVPTPLTRRPPAGPRR